MPQCMPPQTQLVFNGMPHSWTLLFFSKTWQDHLLHFEPVSHPQSGCITCCSIFKSSKNTHVNVPTIEKAERLFTSSFWQMSGQRRMNVANGPAAFTRQRANLGQSRYASHCQPIGPIAKCKCGPIANGEYWKTNPCRWLHLRYIQVF